MPTISPGKTNWDKNIYAYCDNNPVSRKDSGGTCWELLAIEWILGGAFELGTQLISNGGNWSEINWGQVGIAALAGGLTAIGGWGLGMAVSSISSAAIDYIGGIRDIKELSKSALIGAASSLFGFGAGKAAGKISGKIAINNLANKVI